MSSCLLFLAVGLRLGEAGVDLRSAVDLVDAALTVEQVVPTEAGPAWTPEFEQAWGEAFSVVAGAMIEGAEAEELEVAA